MRVVEPDHREPAAACLAPRVDVIFGIDEIAAGRIVRDVGGARDVDNLTGGADQNATAFRWQRFPRVRGDRVERAPPDADGYDASTTIAIPMPPPMQSDATP